MSLNRWKTWASCVDSTAMVITAIKVFWQDASGCTMISKGWLHCSIKRFLFAPHCLWLIIPAIQISCIETAVLRWKRIQRLQLSSGWAFTRGRMRSSTLADVAPIFSIPSLFCLRAAGESNYSTLFCCCLIQLTDQICTFIVQGCIFDDLLCEDCKEWIISVVRHDDVGQCRIRHCVNFVFMSSLTCLHQCQELLSTI